MCKLFIIFRQNSEKQAIDAIDVKLVKPFDLPDANLDK